MPPRSPFADARRRLARRLGGPATVPAALVLLVALAGALAARVHAADRARGAAAVRALREYAGFAAWQIGRRAEEHLGCLARSSTFRAYDARLGAAAPLPPPSVLDPDTTGATCGFGRDTRLAFRIAVPGGALATSGSDAAAARLVARLAPALTATAPPADAPRDARAALRFDTLGGVRVGVAYAAIHDSAGRPRAVYGVVGTLGARLTEDLDDILALGPVLPPSLVGAVPTERAVHVAVAFPDGAPAYARGAGGASAHAAAETLPPATGGLVVRVALAPAVASALLAARAPASRLPLLLAVLALAVGLAGVALAQLRRGRELERLRTRFVADVSHELRTPLAHIAMFSETLALGRERSPAERRHFAGAIHRETRRLTLMVESVLRFARADYARRAPAPDDAPAPRDVGADARDAVAAFTPLAEAEEVAVEAAIADGALARVPAGAVRQLLFNLLDNAVKYGPRGQRVVVRVWCEGGEARLAVEDEGPGIASADRERAFEPFTRLDRPGAPHVTGTGIGLAVVRDVVCGAGGRVWIEDARAAAACGTRVVCAFPAAAGGAATPAARAAAGTAEREPALR
jgi:signal transduction histidine kinase